MQIATGIKNDLPKVVLMLIFLLSSTSSLPADDLEAPHFSLPRMATNERVNLSDYKGEIVVLDFFAYWCDPCKKSSPLIESGIQKYYSARNGNRNGIPVRVLGISVDHSDEQKVSDFVKTAGLKEVLIDADGAVLERFGGGGIPLIVVISLVDSQPAIVYQSTGFDGLGSLRAAIDKVSAAATQQTIEEPVPAHAPDASYFGTTVPATQSGDPAHKISPRTTLLTSSDAHLTDTLLEYEFSQPGYQLTAAISHGYIGMDFIPFDTVLMKNKLKTERLGFNASGRFNLMDTLSLTLGSGFYEGFIDYKSVWLDEYYRQLFGTVNGYEEAAPHGHSFSTALRWEYLPTRGFLQAALNYQYDIVSPAYSRDISSFPPSLVRDRNDYKTISGGLTLENILTPRLRTLQEIHAQETTDRALHISGKTSLNYALTDSLVWRAELSASEEDPSFSSWSAGATLEKDWDDTWFISLSARYYEDTGQIEIALPGNASAPEVQTYQAALGLRWQGANSSIKAVAGPYFNRYLSAPADQEFQNLYRDRDWVYLDLAYSLTF